MTINTGQAQNFSQSSTRQSTTTNDQNGAAELRQAFNEQRTRLELLSQSSTSLDILASSYSSAESLLRQGSLLESFSRIAPLDTLVAEMPVTNPNPVTEPTRNPHTETTPQPTPTPQPDNTPTPTPSPQPDNTPTPSPHPEPEPDNTPTPSPHPEAPSNDPIPGPSPIYQEPSDSPDTPPQVPCDIPPPPSENPAIAAPPETLPDFPSFPSIGQLLRPLLGALGGTLGPALAGLGGLLYPSPLGNGELTPEQIANANGMNAMSDDEVQQAVDELADEYPDYTPDEFKELAKEPNGTIRENNIQEVKAALEAEKLGIVDGPLQPSVHVGHDFRAGDPPQDWDVKGYDSERPFDAESALDKIEERDLPNDENILFDTTNMTEEDTVELETELESRPNFNDRYEFVPPR